MNVNWICVHRSHAKMVANAVKSAAQLSSVNVPIDSMGNFVKRKSIAAALDRFASMVERALKLPITKRFANVRPTGSVSFARFDRISVQINRARVASV